MLNVLTLPASRNSSDTPSPSVSAHDALSRSQRTSSHKPVMSMVSRVQARDEELRRHFDLQPGELFMDEFYCALHKKILLQGRMYVFENYVCFYSNLFGWVKKKVIPLAEVIEISKKRHYGFPNSIRIVWNSKKEFFTSFLSREDAYVLLINVWNQAQLAAQTSEPGRADSFASGRPSAAVNNSAASDTTQGDDDSGEDIPMAESPLSTLNPVDKTQSWESARDMLESKRRNDHVHASGISEGSDEDEEDDDDEWHPEASPAPPIASSMQSIVEEDFDISAQVFFNKIFSDDSVFFEEIHKGRGDQRFQTSPWQTHSHVCGRVRHTTFISPVKSRLPIGRFAPSTAACTQNQRCCMYSDGHLVFETSQVHTGLPYGDCFQVRVRWDVTSLGRHASPSEGCHLQIHAEVPFTRTVLAPIRRMINTAVFKELRETVDQMVALMRETFTSASLSFSEGSEDSLHRGEDDLPDNMHELLNHKEFRQWIVRMVREEFGAGGPGEAPGLSPRRSRPRGSLDLDRLSNSGSRRALRMSEGGWSSWVGLSKLPRPGRGISQPGAVVYVAMGVVFLLQMLNLFLWMFAPSGLCGGGGPAVGTLGVAESKLVSYLSHVQEDLKRLQVDLEGLVQAVGLGIGHISKVVNSFEQR
ncbi:unnamed protein product [Ostreobium quekettii]|uniref:VASt domain-containing protein n=1 Tax=Ostreobium quekettii TaxID=121088 RepID=A0A8S1J576_9CHLO|nr:unnamed protein product [Ostreobium quekettii]